MARFFWTSQGASAITPKRRDLFMVEMGLFSRDPRVTEFGGVELPDNEEDPRQSRVSDAEVWFAKSIQKPSFALDRNTRAIDGKYSMNNPRTPIQSVGGYKTFEPINITIIDPDVTVATLGKSRYSSTRRVILLLETLSKRNIGEKLVTASNRLGFVKFYQYGRNIEDPTKPLVRKEEWDLFNPYLVSAQFSDLDYSSAESNEITLSIGYTGFQVTMDDDENRDAFGSKDRTFVIGDRVIDVADPNATNRGGGK